MSMGYKRCLSFFLSRLTFLAGVLYTIISCISSDPESYGDSNGAVFLQFTVVMIIFKGSGEVK